MAEKDWIARYFAPLAPNGLSDDVASLDVPGPLIVTSDSVVEGVHFLPADPIETVARKLVRRNVSDIHAKGARPHEVLLNLGWPETRTETDLAAFADALGDDLRLWGARLIGGDTTTSLGGLFASLTMTGHCSVRGAPVQRVGAQPGDRVWVTGDIGAACLGFDDIKQGRAGVSEPNRYRVPQPAPQAAADLVAGLATSSIDISDGLLADALALARASGVMLTLDLDQVPFAAPTVQLADRIRLASWGDDYQILFTGPPERSPLIDLAAASSNFQLTEIGQVAAGLGLRVLSQGSPINLPETLGFEHGRIGRSAIRP